eukprot:g10413.t1
MTVASTRPEFEKVWNTYGSSAGSGSCSIPIYYKHRRIELARLEKMDKDHAALEEAASFQAKREAQILADEATTDKKRAKRQKRRDAKVKNLQMKKEADGINQFGSDGSFLEMMAKMDPKALEAEVQKTKEQAQQAAKEAAAAKASTISGALGIDNGLGLTPPRGWRSWNSFDCLEPSRILTQEHMIAQMDAVLDQSRSVDGKPTSLAQLGFDWISMDDGWQRCNCSVRQDLDPTLPTCDGNLCFGGHCSWHDASGRPRVRPDRFPDMKKLVDYGHARQLKVGTYLNNCICNEHGEPHYEEDVAWMVHEMGFDGVKIDNCGSSTNVTHWAELINRTGKALRIENCHNSWPDFKTGVCPMNFFRTGGDISADISSILNEAYATVDAADLPEPRSGPGCWAYPDMSEVGNFAPGPSRDDQERTHWGLWSIISSPLILGFDLNDSQTMDGGPCDGSVESTKWSFQGGQLRTPLRGTGPTCLTTQSVPCPPPTTAFPHVQCGLAARNCSELPSGDWTLSGGRIQWNDHHSQLSCLYANPIDFNTSTGYFTRKAATVGVSATGFWIGQNSQG